MNSAQIKCLCVFAVFAVIGFGPVSPGCLIGIYIVAFRPYWFWALANSLYADLPRPQPPVSTDIVQDSKQARKKCFFGLLGLFILDIAPVPVTPVVAFFIITIRPLWFYRLIARIYGNTQAS